MSNKIVNFLCHLFAVSLLFGISLAVASEPKPSVSANQALKMLMDGNADFVSGKSTAKDIADGRRKELAKGQAPFAIILGCADSRVAPEHVFNQGLGDIFIVRVAGNVADPIELGSIEYAAEHLGSPLIMVLGHRKCGAVKATVDNGGKPMEGNIGAIVAKINPAVEAAKKSTTDKDKLLDASIDMNAKMVAQSLTEKSSVLRHLVESGKVKIVTAVYDLSSGKVDIIDSGAATTAAPHKH